jgi:hypothetical protein
MNLVQGSLICSLFHSKMTWSLDSCSFTAHVLVRIREVPCSNTSLEAKPAILTEVFVVFLIFSRQIVGKYLKLGHDPFPPHPFHFLIAYLMYAGYRTVIVILYLNNCKYVNATLFFMQLCVGQDCPVSEEMATGWLVTIFFGRNRIIPSSPHWDQLLHSYSSAVSVRFLY